MWFNTGKRFFNQGESDGKIVARQESAMLLTDTASVVDQATQAADSIAPPLSKGQKAAYIRGYVAGYEHTQHTIWRQKHSA